MDWILNNWIEITAAVLGLIGIGLQIKQNHWYWLTSIMMVLMYIYVFFYAKFYADMSFQIYYLVISIYGWIYWIKNKRKNKNKVLVVNILSKNKNIAYILVTAVLCVAIYLILTHFTDSPIPLGDAFTTALSITATWLLAKKYLENWIYWIIVDAVSSGLYLYKELYPTLILFLVLTGLAIVGYVKWKRYYQQEKAQNE